MVNRLNKYIKDELGESFSGIGHCVVVNCERLTAEESVALRSELRSKSIRMRVTPNRIGRLALDEAGLRGVGDLLRGQCAILTGGEDMPSVAKAATEWIKKNKKMAVRGGFAEGRLLDEAGVQTMADIPPRPVLLAMIAGAVNNAPQKVAWALQSVHSSLARALEEIRKQKGGGAEEAPAAE